MKTLATTLTVLFLAGIFATTAVATADLNGPKIGDAPPPFTQTKTLQGPPASEISWDKLRGKVVVLEFWATWCGPCVHAIPHLNELAEQFTNRPVVFISVTQENPDVIRSFLTHHPMKAWIDLDEDGVLYDAFHVVGIPHTVIVDATGHIAAIVHPALIKPENIDEVLAGRKSSLPPPTVYGQQPMTGIGLELRMRHDALEIDWILPDTPAAKSGLRRGMIIQQIDGTNVAGKPLRASIGMIRGQPGTRVQLEVFDPASGQTNTVDVTRERFYVPVVGTGMITREPSQSSEPASP